MKKAIICDLDGTLALFEGNPYDRDFSKDEINYPVLRIIETMADVYCGYDVIESKLYDIIVLSGRNDKYKKETKKWLKKYEVPYSKLFMRKEGDKRKDTVVKKEIFDNYIKGKYNVLCAIDDRKQMKRLWVSEGIFVLDVNQTDEEF